MKQEEDTNSSKTYTNPSASYRAVLFSPEVPEFPSAELFLKTPFLRRKPAKLERKKRCIPQKYPGIYQFSRERTLQTGIFQKTDPQLLVLRHDTHRNWAKKSKPLLQVLIQ